MDSPYPTLQLTLLNGVTPIGVRVCNETLDKSSTEAVIGTATLHGITDAM